MSSSENAHVPYSGIALQSGRRYHFRILVWDGQGKVVASAPASFAMGLMDPQDWQAKWVGLAHPEVNERSELVGSSWIWSADTITPAPTRLALQKTFELPPGSQPVRAELLVAGNDLGKPFYREARHVLRFNDKSVASWSAPISDPRTIEVLAALQPGTNRIAIASPYQKDAAFIATLTITMRNGDVIRVRTDQSWLARPLQGGGNLSPGWDNDEQNQASAKPVTVVAAFGQWSGHDSAYDNIDKVVPPILLRKTFKIDKPIKQAMLYATAAGVYEPYINGERAGRDVLAPGWTDYGKHIRYQTYDVTKQTKRGENVLAAVVADGWYSGRTGIGQNLWGFNKALLAQLVITYRDGSSEVVATDTSWLATTGPWRKADLLDGEAYDARQEIEGWALPHVKGGNWRQASVLEPHVGRLESQIEPPVRRTGALPVRKILPASGGAIFDFGQNLVGWAKVRLRAKRGTTLTFRWAEVLTKEGALFTENLRSALATDHYTARGGGVETYEPRFTFHGFRYLQIKGLTQPLSASDVTAVVVNSDLPMTGTFTTSNADLNRLQNNIVWSQRGNFLSVPTDCPQRDERLGWTGDINIFAPTAMFNMDAARFLHKYLIDLEDGQHADGAFSDIAPTVPKIGAGNFGWGDAGVFLPWLVYQNYGDTRVLAAHYDAAKRWVDYRTGRTKDDLNRDEGWGDWLSPKPQTSNAILSPMYHAQAASVLSRSAEVLGKLDDAKTYKSLADGIRKAFAAKFVGDNGTLKDDTQTAYAIALRFGMLDGTALQLAPQHLARTIAQANDHLSTGFLGTGHLLTALSLSGRTDLAWKLLLTDTYPSWLFSVRNGATTIWERWNGYGLETGPNNEGNMNSYNHYAFGAVGEWMYQNVAGLEADPAEPGWRRALVHPAFDKQLKWARAAFESIRGRFSTSWRQRGDKLELEVEVPVHARAEVRLPYANPASARESGVPLHAVKGLRVLSSRQGATIVEVGPGHYRFVGQR